MWAALCWRSSLCTVGKAEHCCWRTWMLTSDPSALCNPPPKVHRRVSQSLCLCRHCVDGNSPSHHLTSLPTPLKFCLSVTLSHTYTQHNTHTEQPNKTWSRSEEEIEKIFQVWQRGVISSCQNCAFKKKRKRKLTTAHVLGCVCSSLCWSKQMIRLNGLRQAMCSDLDPNLFTHVSLKNEAYCVCAQWSMTSSYCKCHSRASRASAAGTHSYILLCSVAPGASSGKWGGCSSHEVSHAARQNIHHALYVRYAAVWHGDWTFHSGGGY